MAGDLNKPVTTDGYEAVLTYLRDNFAALVTLLDSRGAGASNLPANAKRWNDSNATFESWESSAWVVKTLSIAGGGTGATTAAAARAALGTNDAANITTGTLGADRLPTVPVTKGGTGLTTLTSGSFLQGNGTGNVVLRTAAQVRSDLGLGTAALSSTGDFISSAAGSVGSANLASSAVTEDKIGAAAVTEAKLGTGAVTAGKIGTGAVTEEKIGTGAVTGAKIGAEAVSLAKLAADVLPNFLHIRDEKTSGTHGGTFDAGAWRTRTLNTVKYNGITGASLASNKITLPAGDYWIEAAAPALGVEYHQAALYNVTDAAYIMVGPSIRGWDNYQEAPVRARVSFAAAKEIEVRHYCSNGRATDGFGRACGFSSEVYTEVFVRRIK